MPREAESETPAPDHTIIPNPATVELTPGDTFHIEEETVIAVEGEDPRVEWIGRYLADLIGNTTETTPSLALVDGRPPEGSIHLTLEGASEEMGAEGYDLTVTGSLGIVQHLLENRPEGGYYTPSLLMGSGYAASLPGVRFRRIS